MAALAVLALGITVWVALRALHDAEGTIVRGESQALTSALVQELAEETEPISDATLERALQEHGEAGLRYLALFERNGSHRVAEAGRATMAELARGPNESAIEGDRVRVTTVLLAPRRARRNAMPWFAGRGGMGPPWLVVEFEPPVIRTLRNDLVRISFVAAGAGGVLLAFAFAWSRSVRKLETLEHRRAHEQRLIALGSMSSVMAHELRNPLASLKGHAQLLAEDLEQGDAKQLRKAERVVAEAERLERLTTSLLEFVRDGALDSEPTPTRDLVARALDDLDTSRVQVDDAQAPERVEIDLPRLARALHNVVDNALQAATDAHVTLRLGLRDGGLEVQVRDHGPGLPAGSESKIFEPFVTTRVRGTGLGLAIARRIVEQHGGRLTGENHPQGGALFTLHIPRARA